MVLYTQVIDRRNDEVIGYVGDNASEMLADNLGFSVEGPERTLPQVMDDDAYRYNAIIYTEQGEIGALVYGSYASDVMRMFNCGTAAYQHDFTARM